VRVNFAPIRPVLLFTASPFLRNSRLCG